MKEGLRKPLEGTNRFTRVLEEVKQEIQQAKIQGEAERRQKEERETAFFEAAHRWIQNTLLPVLEQARAAISSNVVLNIKAESSDGAVARQAWPQVDFYFSRMQIEDTASTAKYTVSVGEGGRVQTSVNGKVLQHSKEQLSGSIDRIGRAQVEDFIETLVRENLRLLLPR